jgi:hypothetical protein
MLIRIVMYGYRYLNIVIKLKNQTEKPTSIRDAHLLSLQASLRCLRELVFWHLQERVERGLRLAV